MRRWPYILMLMLVLGTFVPRVFSADLRCVVCESRIQGTFFWMANPALADKQSVCEPCSKIEERCTICRLPVSPLGRKLPDGRLFCPKDFEAAVVDEREALRIYEEARRDLQGILAGSGNLPGSNIKVSIVDETTLKKLNQTLPSAHDDSKVLGLTRSRVRNKTEFQHDIYLLNGLGPARLAAVAAHEYTHTWIHENVPADRKLEHDSVEGFCELVAYKLMSQRKEEVEKQVIMANAYTRGQVNAFVQAESEHQFHRVIKWLKTGIDEVLPPTNSAKVLAVKTEPVESVWPPPAGTLTRVPDRLELKGISGKPGRRFALVNNCTVARGDRAQIRYAQTSVDVRCLDVRERSVVLQVEGQSQPVELFLKSAPATLVGQPAAPPAQTGGRR